MGENMKIYTDASFDDKRKTGGWGLIKEHNNILGKPISNFGKFESVNEAELFAIYTACILAGGSPCEIITDSQTALSYIKREIKDKPRTHEQYINHKHCEYWAVKNRKRGIQVEKIKGHRNIMHPHYMGNRSADLEAEEGRANYYANTLRIVDRMYER